MTSPPKKHGGPRPNSGPKPTAGTPRTVDITSAYTPDEAERLRAIAAGSPLAAVQREAVLARHPEIATGEGPASSHGTNERRQASTPGRQKAQRAAMSVRTCPACERGNALTSVEDAAPGEVSSYCRYCKWARIRPARPEIVTGEGGPFRPATPEHTRERDVAKGRSRKKKHRKAGEEP
jgi:hypothetical protein